MSCAANAMCRLPVLATGTPRVNAIATSAVDVLWFFVMLVILLLNCQQIFFAIICLGYFAPVANNREVIRRQIQGMIYLLETLLIRFMSIILHKVVVRL